MGSTRGGVGLGDQPIGRESSSKFAESLPLKGSWLCSLPLMRNYNCTDITCAGHNAPGAWHVLGRTQEVPTTRRDHPVL